MQAADLARNRWPDLLTHFGIDPMQLTGKHAPAHHAVAVIVSGLMTRTGAELSSARNVEAATASLFLAWSKAGRSRNQPPRSSASLA